MKWEISEKGRNYLYYGYCMLLTISAFDVRDHLSDREVSTALFLPAYIGSKAGELPRTLQYLRAVDIQYALFLPAYIGSKAGELPRTLQYLRAVDIQYHSRIRKSSLMLGSAKWFSSFEYLII
jgi:hypothetical protein